MHDLLQPCSSLVSITEIIQIDTPSMKWLAERGPTHREFIELDTPESRISAQVGLDDAAWNSNPHVRLAHFSVKEYLVSKRIKSGRAKLYSLKEVDANGAIADECLAYLLQNDRTDSSSLRSLRDYTLAPYAASDWFKHVGSAGEGTRRIATLSKELLTENKDAMTNWLRLYCPDYPSQRCLLHDAYPRLRVETPLYNESQLGLCELLKSLIAEGFDVNTDSAHKGNQDSRGTALRAAIWAGHEQVIQSLLQAGAFFKPSGEKLLGMASPWGRADVIRSLLDLGVDVNTRGKWNEIALIEAASNHGHDAVRLLPSEGADVELRHSYTLSDLLMRIQHHYYLSVGLESMCKSTGARQPLQ
jgi:hypothetical protein